MKKILLLILLNLLQHLSVDAQNLIPNYSFEVDTACPFTSQQIYYARPWFQPSIYFGNVINSSSSDLYDTCSTSIDTSVPIHSGDYQYPRTGGAYAAIGVVLNDTQNYREYLEVPLLTALIANKNYCVSFYVSLSNFSNYAISNMGVYFSTDSLLNSSYHHAIDYVTPQVENPASNILNDTANWMLVSGNFIAVGGEKFMTLGNFHAPSSTNQHLFQTGAAPFAYYYIDDVSVTQCNVGVNDIADDADFKLYPNPANNEINLETKMQNAEIEIRDVLGQVIYSSKVIAVSSAIDVSMLSKGVYFINLQNGKQTINKKFVKE